MNPKHPALTAAENFIQHTHGNLQTFDRALRGDPESKRAIEAVATALHEILLHFCVSHVRQPAGKPLGDLRNQTR
jgi:hypothetical protein